MVPCIFFRTIDYTYRVCTLSLASRSYLDEKVVGAKELQLGQAKGHRQGRYNGTEGKHNGLFWGNILKGVHAEKSNLEVLKRQEKKQVFLWITLADEKTTHSMWKRRKIRRVFLPWWPLLLWHTEQDRRRQTQLMCWKQKRGLNDLRRRFSCHKSNFRWRFHRLTSNASP